MAPPLRTALAARLPTLVMRSDPRIREDVELQREIDPERAAVEHDCELPPAGTGLFFDATTVDRSVDRDRPPALAPDHTVRRCMGADLAFLSDYSAAAVVFERNGVIELADILELKPPIKPSFVAAQFADLARKYGLTGALVDGHCREPMREFFDVHAMGLYPLPEGSSGKVAQYDIARTVLREGRFRMPYLPRLVQQFKTVTSQPTSGGAITISFPRRKGLGHGDALSATVAAIWALEHSRQRRPVHRNYQHLPPG